LKPIGSIKSNSFNLLGYHSNMEVVSTGSIRRHNEKKAGTNAPAFTINNSFI